MDGSEAIILAGFASIPLGVIPAIIASNKGHFFWGWWLFGTLLFVVALPVSLLISPKGEMRGGTQADTVSQLEKLSNLRAQGAISEEEFQHLKERTLRGQHVQTEQQHVPVSDPDPKPTRLLLKVIGIGFAILIIGLVLANLFGLQV